MTLAASGRDLVLYVRSFDVKGNCLASQGLDKNLHAAPQAKHQVKSGLLLDVVIGKGALTTKEMKRTQAKATSAGLSW